MNAKKIKKKRELMKNATVGLISMLSVLSSMACIHPPRDYPGKMGSKVQEYLFFREGKFIHMISNQRVQADKGLPANLAWVIPVPSMPTSYSEESDSLFKKLFYGTEPPPMRGGRVLKSLEVETFSVHETVYVGKYEITPIEILDTSSGIEINNWLFNNGYHRVPIKGLKYYLKPHSCFLAIKVNGLKGKDEVLKPLHIVYEAPQVSVPLKFFAKAGVFDLYVYTISKKPLALQNALAEKGINEERHLDFEPIKYGLKSARMDDAVLTRFSGKAINSRANKIETWNSDPKIDIE